MNNTTQQLAPADDLPPLPRASHTDADGFPAYSVSLLINYAREAQRMALAASQPPSIEQARFIEVSAGVRYWEDGTLDDQEDTDGKMPLRSGDRWCPVIDLATGRIEGWPAGTTADVHYKVCDDGDYWLLDGQKRRIAKWLSHYVPNDLLCVGDNGYGDYIIFKVGADGVVIGWKPVELDAEHWDFEPNRS